jgi:hypothetical protein
VMGKLKRENEEKSPRRRGVETCCIRTEDWVTLFVRVDSLPFSDLSEDENTSSGTNESMVEVKMQMEIGGK